MKHLIKSFVIVLFCFIVALPTSSFANATPTNEPAPSEEYQPITVNSELLKAAPSNKGWDLSVRVSATMNEETRNDLFIEYKLEMVTDSLNKVKEKKKEKLLRKNLNVNKQDSFALEFKHLEAGQYKLFVQANSKKNENVNLGGNHLLLFTITSDGVIEGWSQDLLAYDVAEDENGAAKKIYSNPSEKDYGFEAQAEEMIDQPSNLVSIAATSTFSGYWKLYNRKGSTEGVKYAKAELRYRDSYYIWRVAGTDYTSSTGYFTISFTKPSNANLWELRVYSISQDAGKVENKSGGNFYVYDQWLAISTTNDVGNLYVPNGKNGSEIGRAFWVYNDLATAESRLDDYKDPGNSTIVWYAGSTTGAYYSNGGKVYLRDGSADSPTSTVHELGHNYMYNLYSGDYPPTNCPSPHYIDEESTKGCAWSEGWATFLALYIAGTSVYTTSSGGTIGMENTSTFDTGDDTEGRVAGALWDMYDTANDGNDIYNYSFGSIYGAMNRNVNDTFSAFWYDWKALGYSTNALKCLSQNSINY